MNICVVGLGYVGLPLAAALARHRPVLGFDIDTGRVAELAGGHDRTGELDAAALASVAGSLRLTAAAEDLAGQDVFIVTVPTPIDSAKQPDLSAVLAASRTVAPHLRPGAIVVYESTVYPGVTEDMCGPILAEGSGLACGTDFFLGYSPERINPGDRAHTVEKIVKVVAGQTPEVARTLADLYGEVIEAGIHLAPDIKTAEAAKAIENAQRDINIAFVNEVAIICQELGISAHDVLAAARTKWNFLPFAPGLVGGHCIGVDPYYLARKSVEVGHHPEIILAGRRLNDAMGTYVADKIADLLTPPGKVLVLGITFKEDVPDLRNTRVVDVIARLARRGFQVDVHDAMADPAEAAAEYGVDLMAALPETGAYAAVVGAVAHAAYRDFDPARLAALTVPGGLVADIKGMWRGLDLDRPYWTL